MKLLILIIFIDSLFVLILITSRFTLLRDRHGIISKSQT